MTAVVLPADLLPARRPGTERLQWLAPAPLWDDATPQPVDRPWIAELTSDAFIPEFLAILGGGPSISPAALANTEPARRVGGAATGPYRLFQPVSQRYYLVTASLVCRRPGIPDHAVHVAQGERTSFVLRRLTSTDGEQAWIPETRPSAGGGVAPGAPASGSWVTATTDRVVPGEEQLPMHPAPVAPFALAGSTAAALGMAAGENSTRTVFYGYIPVGRRERSVERLAPEDLTSRLKGLQAGATNPLDKLPPAVVELVARVVDPWTSLLSDAGGRPDYVSLYVLLDLADWLAVHVSTVHTAVANGATTVSGAAAYQNLLDTLQGGTITVTGGSSLTIAEALRAVVPFEALVQGADIAGPGTTYRLDTSTAPVGFLAVSTSGSSLTALAAAAVTAAGTGYTVPPELDGLIVAGPVDSTGAPVDVSYVIRAVYEHEPCQPVLSSPSAQFVLARAVDGDAPARRIRIPLPDIGNMRQFNRGVGLEMPPSLRKVMGRINKDTVTGSLDSPGPGIGMICSFSIQIIFLCAFIILFIFLIILNIVFFWLPFLKICFPVPVPPPPQKAPSP